MIRFEHYMSRNAQEKEYVTNKVSEMSGRKEEGIEATEYIIRHFTLQTLNVKDNTQSEYNFLHFQKVVQSFTRFLPKNTIRASEHM